MQGPALVTLRSGYTYAATSHEFHDGWLSIVGARYWKVMKAGREVTRFGSPRAFSWPRTAVEEVKAVLLLDEPQKVLLAPVSEAVTLQRFEAEGRGV